MKTFLQLGFALLVTGNLSAQAPDIEWSQVYGGSNLELMRQCVLTDDNGYILAGNAFSNNGDVNVHYGYAGDGDWWLLKLDSNQHVVWQKTFGGTDDDYLVGLKQTPDGGYIMVGSVHSNNIQVSFNHGWFDVWVVKIDADGNIEWEKTYGGSLSETARAFTMTSDGGLVIVGETLSNDGDVSGYIGVESSDGWVLKLDATGNLLWQKCLGGTTTDDLNGVIENENHDYVILGYTYSNDGFVSGNHGGQDVWLSVLSTEGEMLFQKCYGGSLDEYGMQIHQTDDLGYIFCGNAKSNNGNVSGHHGSTTRFDGWVVKLDSNFAIQWQNSFGGSQDESIRDIIIKDDGYLFTGSSASIDGDVTSNYGNADMWVVNLNLTGGLIWQKTYGGSDDDYGVGLYEANDGSYLFSARSASDNFDVPFNHGDEDYWFGKFYIECGLLPEVCNSLDDNCNGLIDDAITETITIAAGGPTTFCQGGNVLLTATYSGVTVQWKKNGTNIPGATSPTYLVNSKGTYTCETTSACDTELSTGIFVNVQKNPPASITAGGATTFCTGGSVILTANAGGGLSYQWYKGASLIAGATSINYTATIAGNYKCRVTKTATGCFKNSNVINVSVPCKEGELLNDENVFTIYPNPNDGTFTIEANVRTQDFASQELTTIEIFNNLGQLIYSEQINSPNGIINEIINISNTGFGIYLLKIKQGDYYVQGKIIIE